MPLIHDFHDQVALVTGAASGMGLATARAFAHAGATVVLADIDRAAVEAAAQDLRDAGHHATAHACDVTDDAQVADVVDGTIDRHGRLDAAFNNAGMINAPHKASETSAELWNRLIDINLRGVWHGMKHQLRHMARQGYGAIVNCSSIGGLRGAPGLAAYSASKHGVTGLTRSAALEYAPTGIRINAVCPGMIETPMGDVLTGGNREALDQMATHAPVGRLGTPDEIAAAVLWLCSSDASYVIGHALAIDGGLTAG